MRVQLMCVTLYDDDGWTWRTEEVRNPTWETVEATIRRLDRFRYPFVWLFRSAEVEQDPLPDYSVIGGEGEFAMDWNADGAYHRYYDQSRGDEEIEIWRSDQGATFEAKYCCSSLDTVLSATRYFCEHGTLNPGLIWQPQPR
jgi:hypothetical protein